MSALVLAESADGRLLDATHRLVAAARALSAEVHVAVIDTGAEGPVAGAATLIDGVAKVLVLPSPAPDLAGFDAVAAALAPLACAYEAVLAADSGRGRTVLPLVAAKLKLAPLTSVSAIREDGRFERLIHAASVVETLHFDAPLRLLTVRAAAFPRAAAGAAPCPVEALAALGQDLVTITGREPVTSERPQLETAALVIAGGRGLGSQEAFDALQALAERLNAALGASRVAVDMGWAPHEAQIGQTGRRIAPKLYVALGISGAAQHLAGIREAERVVAVNKDREAPIFRHADLGLAGDAVTVIADLTRRLAGD